MPFGAPGAPGMPPAGFRPPGFPGAPPGMPPFAPPPGFGGPPPGYVAPTMIVRAREYSPCSVQVPTPAVKAPAQGCVLYLLFYSLIADTKEECFSVPKTAGGVDTIRWVLRRVARMVVAVCVRHHGGTQKVCITRCHACMYVLALESFCCIKAGLLVPLVLAIPCDEVLVSFPSD